MQENGRKGKQFKYISTPWSALNGEESFSNEQGEVGVYDT
jgi:hypothetical protein